ncbi:hypothetical protein [Agarivorans litoreus]|uniref:hypothetical protein n=1 Tax=Agarivorans litoreus TaxID=1510455 RepID=UPI001C7CD8AB|nr:hypothetical protein [Agarivorans litoreus]
MGFYDSEIRASEKEISRLRDRIHETFALRNRNEHKLREWESACKEFHERYPKLAFPGGLENALERIVSGDSKAIEAALCFIEIRPFFFRSGYMYKDILRKLRKAPLKEKELERYELVYRKYLEYRRNRVNT